MLYYPCIMDHFGDIKQKVGDIMTQTEAEAFLMKYWPLELVTGKATPQPETTEGLYN